MKGVNMFGQPLAFKECKVCFKIKEIGEFYTIKTFRFIYDYRRIETHVCLDCADAVGNDAYRKTVKELVDKVDPFKQQASIPQTIIKKK